MTTTAKGFKNQLLGKVEMEVPMANVTGLSTALAGKAASSHTHGFQDIDINSVTGRALTLAFDAHGIPSLSGTLSSDFVGGMSRDTSKLITLTIQRTGGLLGEILGTAMKAANHAAGGNFPITVTLMSGDHFQYDSERESWDYMGGNHKWVPKITGIKLTLSNGLENAGQIYGDSESSRKILVEGNGVTFNSSDFYVGEKIRLVHSSDSTILYTKIENLTTQPDTIATDINLNKGGEYASGTWTLEVLE